MKVFFATPRLKKQFEDDRSRVKSFGVEMAKKIKLRLSALDAAESLADFWPANTKPERCHELKGVRANVFSMDLVQPFRLLFTRAATDKVALGIEHGIDAWRQIDAVTIVGIENTHD